MIISCQKVATDCSVLSRDIGRYARMDSIILPNYDIYSETYYRIGEEFPVPFKYNCWEVCTLIEDWIKVYYLMSSGNPNIGHPVYVNSFKFQNVYSPTTTISGTTHDTSYLLKGISEWYSFYHSRPMYATTPMMIHLGELLRQRTEVWNTRDAFMVEMLLAEANSINTLDTYQIQNHFPVLSDLFYQIDRHNAEFPLQNEYRFIPEELWNQVHNEITPKLSHIRNDEYDLMLQYSPSIDMSRLERCICPVALPPAYLEAILGHTCRYSPSIIGQTDLDIPLFIPNELLWDMADIVLQNNLLYFKYVCDNEFNVIEDVMWDGVHPVSSLTRDWFALNDYPRLVEAPLPNVDRLEFELKSGHIIITVHSGSSRSISYYNLIIHMLGPGIIAKQNPSVFTPYIS